MPKVLAADKKSEQKTAEKAIRARGITKPKHMPADPGPGNEERDHGRGVDSPITGMVQSGYSVFNTEVSSTIKDTIMEQATQTKAQQDSARVLANMAAKQLKLDAAAAKKAEREAKAAAKAVEVGQMAVERDAKREAAQIARAAKVAEVVGDKVLSAGTISMIGLRDAKNIYVKATNGQLRSTDPLAEALDAVQPADTVKLAMALLNEPVNKYAALNVGQQSMNYRNRLRGAVRAGTVTVAAIAAFRDEHGMTAWVEAAEAEKTRRTLAKTEAAAAKAAAVEAKAVKVLSVATKAEGAPV